jgi:hypothetical protein
MSPLNCDHAIRADLHHTNKVNMYLVFSQGGVDGTTSRSSQGHKSKLIILPHPTPPYACSPNTHCIILLCYLMSLTIQRYNIFIGDVTFFYQVKKAVVM